MARDHGIGNNILVEVMSKGQSEKGLSFCVSGCTECVDYGRKGNHCINTTTEHFCHRLCVCEFVSSRISGSLSPLSPSLYHVSSQSRHYEGMQCSVGSSLCVLSMH